MQRLLSWSILIIVFLTAGFGLNLMRNAIMDNLANPAVVIWWKIVIGSGLLLGGLLFLGGFVYYQDKKRGRLRKPKWKQQ